MSTDFKRISRTAISAFGATSLLVTSLAIAVPSAAQAANSDTPTKAETEAAINGSLASLRQQIGSINSQITEVEGDITALEAKAAEIQKQIDVQWDVVLGIWKKDYIRGESSGIELIASRDTASELFSQQEYDGQFSEKLQGEVNKLFDLQDENKKMLDEAKEKRDGLVKLRDELAQKIATAEAQEVAKQLVAQQSEEEFQKNQKANSAKQVAAITNGGNRSSAPSYWSGGGGNFSGGLIAGRKGMAVGGSNCVAYAASRGKNQLGVGAAADMRPSTNRPFLGAAMIFARGEQGANGTYGHVGIVVGIYSDGSVELDHANWGGGQTRFGSTGKFF